MLICLLMLSAQKDTTGSILITGKVFDARTMEPIGGATVQIDSLKTITAGDGSYSIKGIKSGFIKAKVEATGYRAHEEVFEIPYEGSYTKNFYLVKKETRLIITVLDDYSGEPVKATVKIDGKSHVTDESGMIELKVPEGEYDLVILPHDDMHDKKSLKANVSGRIKVLKVSLLPTKINLGDLRFESGKAEIKDYMIPKLEEACRIMKRYPDARIIVEGHTDTRGPASYNLKLSKERAEAVKRWFIEHECVNPDRIEAKGYGESRPIVFPEKKPEDYAKNRRVVLRLIMQKD